MSKRHIREINVIIQRTRSSSSSSSDDDDDDGRQRQYKQKVESPPNSLLFRAIANVFNKLGTQTQRIAVCIITRQKIPYLSPITDTMV